MSEHALYKGRLVLLVDDEDDLRELNKKILSRLGFEVFEASSGEEASKEILEVSFDLIISDLSMPNGDGKYLLKKVKEASIKCPVIIMTGFNSEGTKALMELGASGVIEKPVSRKKLKEIVSTFVKINN